MFLNSIANRKLCIQFAFNAEYSPEEALYFTRRSFSSVTLAEVKTLYEEFTERIPLEESEDTNNESSIETPKRASLAGVPAEVLGEILKHSTTEDQNRLHKTSYGLSRFVDGTFKTYEEIQVFLTDSAIQMAVKEQKPKVVRDGEPSRKRKRSEDEEEQQEKTIPVVLEKLKEIFTLPNVKIGKLIIKYEHGVSRRQRKELYSGILSILNELETDLHVEKLTISLRTPDSFFPYVNRMKVGPLVEWNIYNESHSFDQAFSKDKTTQSPHWKNLKSLTVIGFQTHFKLDQFLHIPNVLVKVLNVSIEDVVSYRDKLRQAPKLHFHQFRCNDLDGLLDALKPFTPLEVFCRKGGSYLCDNGERLYFSVSMGILIFSTFVALV